MEEKIGRSQLFWLVINIIVATIILIVPRDLVEQGEQFGWVGIIIAGIIMFIIQAIILKLSFEFSSDGITSDFKELFGKVLGKLISLMYIVAIVYFVYFVIYQGVTFLVFSMPYMPSAMFWVGIGVIAAYLAWTGIENIVRVNKLGMIIVVTSIVVIIVVNIREINFEYLRPMVWDTNRALRSSILASGWFMQPIFVILVLKPYLKSKKIALSRSLYANLFSQLIITILTLSTIMTLSSDLTSQLFFPFFNMARLALQGSEVVIIIAWILGISLKVGIYFFIVLKGIEEVFNLNDYKLLVIPFAIALVSSVWYNTRIRVPDLYFAVNAASTLFLLHYPLLIIILLGYFIKRK
ncbi:GerAB/ArcD/ProY family transporter [Halonatronum saccharophilum]|uniref:GerAB/ArcD/ProY family transporter n=1 Tax=Halonatronum saccharophilum TaxID=150060 RepID=UPI000480A704|nr:GerAB/ArcD/ProY family transporter [Halonatronum saccharophilum]